MKLRQFLRNSFQNAVDKYQGIFFQESERPDPKGEEDATPTANQSENGPNNPFASDFKALADFSEKLNQQIENNADDLIIIGDPNTPQMPSAFPSPPAQQSPVSPVNMPASDFTAGDATATYTTFPTRSSPLSASDFAVSAPPLSGVANHNTATIPINSDFGSDFAVDTHASAVVTSVGKKTSKQKQKRTSYSFTPRQSKENREATAGSVKKKKQSGSLNLKIEKKAQMIRQLSALLDAGMDLRSSLAILEEQEVRSKNIWFFIHDLFVKIEAGDSFSDALAASIAKFDASEIAMVRAGEAVGKLAETLAKMASLMEKKVYIKKKITSAMFYPATVLVVSSAVVLLLTTFVVPKFEKVIVDQIGANAMPKLTTAIIAVSRFVSTHLLQVFIALGLLVALFFAVKTITPVKKMFYGLLLKMPLIGNCIMTWCVVIFSRTFGDLLVCGCSVVESLKMARESIGNYYMKEKLSSTIEDIQQGMSLTDSLRRRSVFPAMAEGLIKVGEESGKLGEMMNKVASAYEEQLNEVIARITSMIEPILVIFLAGFVGAVVIGLFLPLVSLIQNIAT
ncbi:MAG: type II secretion system F family protein [Puniceicoccales bacterium]|jgi:type IV pilus assembly protein PilC|nr:type II secretion system F family protein [Puniceicoccales bacterium]